MLELLQHLFAGVCGQNLAHTWAPGGVPLPCCQRCTGLYAGALAAAVLHLWLRPRPTARFLWIQGLFLLQMIPFGYHWLPQGPLLRTVTGALFGGGVVGFLWLLPAVGKPIREDLTAEKYFTAFALSVALVLALAVSHSILSAFQLTILAVAGLAALTILVLMNLWFLVGQASRLSPSTPPPSATGLALSPSKAPSPDTTPLDARDRRDAGPEDACAPLP